MAGRANAPIFGINEPHVSFSSADSERTILPEKSAHIQAADGNIIIGIAAVGSDEMKVKVRSIHRIKQVGI